MQGFLLSLLLKPLLALAFLGLPYSLACHLWRAVPDGRIRRLLFTSWGEDRGPWMYTHWQRKKHRAYLASEGVRRDTLA